MAQTDITLRAGEASPTDVRLYDTGSAAAEAPILVYLCQTSPQPDAPAVSLTLRAGEASSTDIRLHASSYADATQDTDVILRPVGLPCGLLTSTAILRAVEAADTFAGTLTVVSAATSEIALAAIESPDVATFAIAAQTSAGAAIYAGGWEEWLLRRDAVEVREIASRVAEPVERAVRRAAERAERDELSAKQAAAVLRADLAEIAAHLSMARVERAERERLAAEEYRRAQALLVMYRRLLAQVEAERAAMDAADAHRRRRNKIAAALLIAAATLH